MRVADVLLPLPVKAVFSYLAPDHLDVKVGVRVLVPFGRGKVYTGVVKALKTPSNDFEFQHLKPIKQLLDEELTVSAPLLALYDWIADYYMCSPGEALKASLPSGLKLENELYAEWLPDVDVYDADLSDKEYLVLEALEQERELTLEQVAEIADTRQPRKLLDELAARGLLMMRQRVPEEYKPKVARLLKLSEALRDPGELEAAFARLKTEKQHHLLMLAADAAAQGEVLLEKDALTRLNLDPDVAKQLVKKGFLQVETIEVSRVDDEAYHQVQKHIVLNAAQLAALDAMQNELARPDKRPILLHGVTGSGKTHLYIELIRACVESGKQALYLLPEIGLTKQIIDRVKSAFGARVGVYHSRFSNAERVEIWREIINKKYQIVIGVRSAILLPFDNLGLIVVDEEHDSSFKQNEPSPRYNARDVAVYYGAKFGAGVVLGSATPSVETYYNALQEKYALVELKERATQAKLPEVRFVNMRAQVEHKVSHGLFSDELLHDLGQILERNEQAILFNHRRAYSPFMICTHCGHVPRCVNCDISLSYHKRDNAIRCHYCGYELRYTGQCEVCRQFAQREEGIGTERLEEQLIELFPAARIARMDLDTTRGKHSLQNLIHQFERHEIDFLVGTQMVTKGLDFEDVTLAVVVQADRLLNMPDFRSHEYTYQLLTQFSGRAGRSHKAGRVLIQTFNPEHPVLQLLNQSYRAFYELELAHRSAPDYPPNTRLIRLELQHKERVFLEAQAKDLGGQLRQYFGGQMLGPEYPAVARVRNMFRVHVLLKIKRNISGQWVRQTIRSILDNYYRNAPNKTLRVVIDVDPR